jgi:formylglycine-generating enzyme required for sulfatase activity
VKDLKSTEAAACAGAVRYIIDGGPNLASGPGAIKDTKAMNKILFIMPLLLVDAQPPPDTGKLLQRFVDEFVVLTPGQGKFPASFSMGSDKDFPSQEQPAHKVSLVYPFSMAKYEMTQELYAAIAGKNPSKWKGPRNSVEMVNWDEAKDFCRLLTQELRKSKLIAEDVVIRLPSEAEWEYACRAGTTTKYSFGDDAKQLGDFAWFTGNAKGNDPPVGVKKPNPWGLYDMHGYVWEWCLDAWRDDYKDAPTDGSPVLMEKAKKRVIRGGAWTETADKCRSGFRVGAGIEERTPAIGFRCVRSKKVYD